MYEVLKDKLHHELEKMDEKYDEENRELSMGDIEIMDKVAHILKSLICIEDRSYRRDRSYSRYSDRERR